MIMHKSKYLFWIIVIIAAVMCFSVILCNIWAIKFIVSDVGEPTKIGPFFRIPAHKPLTKEHISAISTIVTPSGMFIVNLILVVITLYYAGHTAKMAESTTRVAEETSNLSTATQAAEFVHHQEWKIIYRPLFMPNKDESRLTQDFMSFLFMNVGQHAIFVEFAIDGHNDKFRDKKHKVLQWQEVEFGEFRTTELMTEVLTNSPEIKIIIEFHDILLNKYKQRFTFNWKQMKFVIDKSCRPEEGSMQFFNPSI